VVSSSETSGYKNAIAIKIKVFGKWKVLNGENEIQKKNSLSFLSKSKDYLLNRYFRVFVEGDESVYIFLRRLLQCLLLSGLYLLLLQ